MPYRLVRGEFLLYYQGARTVGSKPDGDSMWFKPDDPKKLKGLDGRSAKLNKGGCAQLRFEGIDAVELHFEGSHQDLTAAKAARDFNLKEAGFRTVTYSGQVGMTVKDAVPHPVKGYILTKSIDPYGRPVSFVFVGSPGKSDGSDLYLGVPLLNKSINADLARSGNAYPAFYTGLPTELRRQIAKLAALAKKERKGVWLKDKTNSGLTITGKTSLEASIIWPKLFRRLASYFKDGKKTGISGFSDWLQADEKRDDALWIISEGSKRNMHAIIKTAGNRLTMLHKPDDVIIEPR